MNDYEFAMVNPHATLASLHITHTTQTVSSDSFFYTYILIMQASHLPFHVFGVVHVRTCGGVVHGAFGGHLVSNSI